MKAGVCLQLSNTSDRDAWRRRGLIEANLLQTVTRGVVAASWEPSRDYHGACACSVRQIIPYTEVLVSLVRFSQ